MLTISMWGGRGVCVGKRFFKLETKKKVYKSCIIYKVCILLLPKYLPLLLK